MSELTNRQTVEGVNQLLAELQQAARDGQLIQSDYYATEAAGRAAVGDGETFKVQGAGKVAALLYRRTNSAASTLLATFPASSAVDSVAEEVTQISSRIPERDAKRSFVPLCFDARGKIPVWLLDGEFDVRDVTERFRSNLGNSQLVIPPGRPIPLARVGNKVAIWLDKEGRLGAKGLIPGLMPNSQPVAQRNSATDGRYLSRYRAKMGTLKAGGAEVVRIGIAGDSWAEGGVITTAVRNGFETSGYERSGEGWQSVVAGTKLGGIVLSHSGWAAYDASETTSASPVGTGIDGQAIYATGTQAAATLSNANCTALKIYYRNTTGTFRYRLDGGSWVSVVGAGDNSLGIVSLSGLALAAHQVDFDLMGNTGTVGLLGFSVLREDVAGVQINKIGNGGMRSARMGWVDSISPIAAEVQLDLLIHILGTNDYRNVDSPPAVYREKVAALIQAHRAANPDLSVLLVCPAQSNGVAVNPLAAYRDVLYELGEQHKCEVYSMLDRFGPFASTNALGQWADDLHVSNRGGANMVRDLNSQFLM